MPVAIVECIRRLERIARSSSPPKEDGGEHHGSRCRGLLAARHLLDPRSDEGHGRQDGLDATQKLQTEGGESWIAEMRREAGAGNARRSGIHPQRPPHSPHTAICSAVDGNAGTPV